MGGLLAAHKRGVRSFDPIRERRVAPTALPAIALKRSKILSAVENTLNDYSLGRNGVGDGDAAFKASHAQAGHHVIARGTALGEDCKTVAVGNDTGDIAVRPRFIGVVAYILVQRINLAYREWGEYDVHKVSPLFGGGATGLDPAQNGIGGNALGRFSKILLVASDHLLT